MDSDERYEFASHPKARLINGVRVLYMSGEPWFALCDVAVVIGHSCAEFRTWIADKPVHKVPLPGRGLTYNRKGAAYVCDAAGLEVIAGFVSIYPGTEWVSEWCKGTIHLATTDMPDASEPVERQERYAEGMRDETPAWNADEVRSPDEMPVSVIDVKRRPGTVAVPTSDLLDVCERIWKARERLGESSGFIEGFETALKMVGHDAWNEVDDFLTGIEFTIDDLERAVSDLEFHLPDLDVVEADDDDE